MHSTFCLSRFFNLEVQELMIYKSAFVSIRFQWKTEKNFTRKFDGHTTSFKFLNINKNVTEQVIILYSCKNRVFASTIIKFVTQSTLNKKIHVDFQKYILLIPLKYNKICFIYFTTILIITSSKIVKRRGRNHAK